VEEALDKLSDELQNKPAAEHLDVEEALDKLSDELQNKPAAEHLDVEEAIDKSSDELQSMSAAEQLDAEGAIDELFKELMTVSDGEPPEAETPEDTLALPAAEEPAAEISEEAPVSGASEPSTDEPEDEARPSASASESEPQQSESRPLIEDFQTKVQRQPTEEEKRREDQTETPDAAAIENCLNLLLAASEDYLETRDETEEAEEDDEPLRYEVESAETRDAWSSAGERRDAATDLADEPADEPAEVSRRKDQSEQLAAADDDLDGIDPATCLDTLTGVANRRGFEVGLMRWWKKDPQWTRKLSVIMVDIDRFSEINNKHGKKVGDRILCSLAMLLKAEKQDAGSVSRVDGKKFAVRLPDCDTRVASKVAERIRQTVERSRFLYKDAEIDVTVSCAVTETNADDAADTILDRAESTMREAKRYGRNRTFLYEGKYPTPIVPPNFSLEGKQITL